MQIPKQYFRLAQRIKTEQVLEESHSNIFSGMKKGFTYEPKYDLSGSIVSRSIVGKPEQYLRMRRKLTEADKTVDSTILRLKQSILTHRIRKSQQQRSHPSNPPSNMTSQRDQEQKTETHLQSQLVQQPICEAIKESDVKKDFKILDFYRLQQKSWEKINSSISRRVQRPLTKSLITKSQAVDFRLRKVTHLEPVVPTCRLWENSLRNDEQDGARLKTQTSQNNYFITNSKPETFKVKDLLQKPRRVFSMKF